MYVIYIIYVCTIFYISIYIYIYIHFARSIINTLGFIGKRDFIINKCHSVKIVYFHIVYCSPYRNNFLKLYFNDLWSDFVTFFV